MNLSIRGDHLVAANAQVHNRCRQAQDLGATVANRESDGTHGAVTLPVCDCEPEGYSPRARRARIRVRTKIEKAGGRLFISSHLAKTRGFHFSVRRLGASGSRHATPTLHVRWQQHGALTTPRPTLRVASCRTPRRATRPQRCHCPRLQLLPRPVGTHLGPSQQF